MKKAVSVILLVCILLSCCSCSKIQSLFSKNSEQSFSYPISEMPKTLDPQIASSESELIVIENCMEGLVRINSEGKPVPAVAQSWEVSADGKKYTFHLSPDAKWSVDTDDEDFELEGFNSVITADDFVFAVSRAVKKETDAPDFQSVSLIKNALKIHSSGSKNTSSLGIKAVDANTLVITLESANSDFLSSLASAVFMPCNEQFFEYCSGRYGRQAKYFLSNAGFELRAWNETNLVMRKNDNYTLSNAAKGDSVTLYRDENAYDSFKNDNYDAIAVGDDYIDDALADSSLTVQQYDDTVWALALNCKSTLCSNKNFRQALALCVNREELKAPEWTSTASGIVPNICTAGGENYRSAAGKANIPKYNASKAAQKYYSAYETILKQTDEEQLPTLKLLCPAAFNETAKHIVQGWQKNFGTGFEVKIDVLGLEELEEAVGSGNYDATIMPVSADTMDALVFLKKFSADNDFGYKSSTYDKIINSASVESTKCRKCENTLLADAVIYPVFTSNSYYVQRNSVKNIYFYAFGGKVNFLNAERVK